MEYLVLKTFVSLLKHLNKSFL